MPRPARTLAFSYRHAETEQLATTKSMPFLTKCRNLCRNLIDSSDACANVLSGGLLLMSILHVRQIKTTLERLFDGNLDLSDLAGRAEAERNNAFLTRALAAYVLAYHAGISPEQAATAVTDGFNDNGIDAVYYHASHRTLYLVQSKWHHNGRGSVTRSDLHKFLIGLNDILAPRWDRFNDKIQQRAADIEAALNDIHTRIVLIIAYAGQDTLAERVRQDLTEAIERINDASELVSAHVMRLTDVYNAVLQGLEGSPIDIQLMLYNWGQVREPYAAFYGQVAASDLANWYKQYRDRLFTPNIRMFLGPTDVNATILDTLLHSPKDFWYFNNGITALCRSISKLPIGGSDTSSGIFQCHDFRIVNGAQTVGAIAAAAEKNSTAVQEAKVQIRVISLEECPPDFDKAVTRYTNTQNRIDRRDFVALDPEQARIRRELEIDGIEYVYKSGETIGNVHDRGFDLVEATVARACRLPDVELAVQAKREIGRLWEDIEKRPYKLLFNGSVTGPSLWRLVRLIRIIEDTLRPYRSQSGRSRLLAVHGNRFIAHLVLNCLPVSDVDSHEDIDESAENRVRRLTKLVYEEVLRLVNHHFPDSYLGSLFKNATKCRQLKQQFSCPKV